MAHRPGRPDEQQPAVGDGVGRDAGHVHAREPVVRQEQCGLDRRRSEHVCALPRLEPGVVDLRLRRRERHRRNDDVGSAGGVAPLRLRVDGDVQARAGDQPQDRPVQPDAADGDDDLGHVCVGEGRVGQQERSVGQRRAAAGPVAARLGDDRPAQGVGQLVDELDRLGAVMVAEDDDAARRHALVVEQGVQHVVERRAHPGHEPRVRRPRPAVGPAVEVLGPVIVAVGHERLGERDVEVHRAGTHRIGRCGDHSGDRRAPVADLSGGRVGRRGHVDRQAHVAAVQAGLPDGLVRPHAP